MKKQFYIQISLLCIVSTYSVMHAQLRIMSYNVRRRGKEKRSELRWKNRLPLVSTLIKRINPDIFGLQEPTSSQMSDLNQALPEYHSFGKGRGTSWLGRGANEHTPIFYKKNRFELLSYGTFSISSHQGRWMPWHAKTTGWLPRICTWGKFKDKKTGKILYLYNTHLDHMYHIAQLNGLTEIKKHLPSDPNALVLITGDFNAPFSSDMQHILPTFQTARQLAQTVIGPLETRTGWDNSELKHIDHILLNNISRVRVPLFQVITKQANEPYPSDHRPIVADLSFLAEKYLLPKGSCYAVRQTPCSHIV